MTNRGADAVTGLTTDDLTQTALDLADMTELPADSAVYVPGANIRRVMMGVDIGAAELMLGKQLGVDAVIAHHPAGGAAQLNYARVLDTQTRFLRQAGVADDVAVTTIAPKIRAADLTAQTRNFDHVPSVARLLEMPFLNVHLPLDEYGRRVMDDAVQTHLATVNSERTATVRDVIDALRTLPELRDAETGIEVAAGDPTFPAGRVFVFHGAGTNGGYAAANAMWDAGIGTVVYIHIAPSDAAQLVALNRPDRSVVISGHIASDMIGINRYVAELERRGVEVIRMSGL